jgi:hypothetical protein
MTAEPSFRTSLIVADRPRAIDDVIDYFGNSQRPKGAHPARDTVEDHDEQPPLTA